MIKCERCNQSGKVPKCLRIGDTCDFMRAIMSFIIGGIISAVLYILLKLKLSFDFFGVIFYFLGALSILSILCQNSFSNVLREKETLFKNIIDLPILLILIIILSYFNTKLGRYLILSDKIIINLINIIYFIIQGTCIVFIIYIINELRDIKTRIICPLCEGNKFIEERIFDKMKRCESCSKHCGYENGKSCQDIVEFCKKCKGKGYLIKNY